MFDGLISVNPSGFTSIEDDWHGVNIVLGTYGRLLRIEHLSNRCTYTVRASNRVVPYHPRILLEVRFGSHPSSLSRPAKTGRHTKKPAPSRRLLLSADGG